MTRQANQHRVVAVVEDDPSMRTKFLSGSWTHMVS